MDETISWIIIGGIVAVAVVVSYYFLRARLRTKPTAGSQWMLGLVVTLMSGGAVVALIAFGTSPQVFFGLYNLYALFLGAFLALSGSLIGIGLAYATKKQWKSP